MNRAAKKLMGILAAVGVASAALVGVSLSAGVDVSNALSRRRSVSGSLEGYATVIMGFVALVCFVFVALAIKAQRERGPDAPEDPAPPAAPSAAEQGNTGRTLLIVAGVVWLGCAYLIVSKVLSPAG